jgi:hypothetical protein
MGLRSENCRSLIPAPTRSEALAVAWIQTARSELRTPLILEPLGATRQADRERTFLLTRHLDDLFPPSYFDWTGRDKTMHLSPVRGIAMADFGETCRPPSVTNWIIRHELLSGS